jgi:uncharacterized RDD family membrane protein YckC
MEFYLSIKGEQSGPHTQFEIIDRIREGKLHGDELVWQKGATDWLPAKQLPEFEGYWPVTPDMIAKAEEARRLARSELDRPQPWLRFWARMVDYLWFYAISLMILAAALPQEALAWLMKAIAAQAPVNSVLFLLFVPLEAWMLSRHGSTPGKSLLRIQVVRNDGRLPTYRQALVRSLLVFIRGYALGLGVINLFTMSWARVSLLTRGITSWDESTELRVEHGEPEVWRIMILIAAIMTMSLGTAFVLLLNPEVKEMMQHLPK